MRGKNQLSKFQALFVLWLRHENYCGCSWRALAGHFYARYGYNLTLKPFKSRESYEGFGGNQIDGMELEEKAFRILVSEPLFLEPVDLFEIDLNKIDKKFNIKKK